MNPATSPSTDNTRSTPHDRGRSIAASALPHEWMDAAERSLPSARPELDAWLEETCRAAADAKAADEAGWWATIEAARSHALLSRLHECPYQRRAFQKPRGYAGDARMLDMIYDGLAALPGEEQASLSSFGQELFHAYQARDSCESIRERRRELARRLDAVGRREGGRALAVACGHLRELDLVDEPSWAGIREIVALDQDPASLDGVLARYAHRPVTPFQARIQDLVRGAGPAGPFDLVYAAGLYDYLPEPLARRLTTTLAAQLAPGGVLLLGNMEPRPEMPFADVVQAWTLIERDPDQMRALAQDVTPSQYDTRVWEDPWKSIVWLEIRRADPGAP